MSHPARPGDVSGGGENQDDNDCTHRTLSRRFDLVRTGLTDHSPSDKYRRKIALLLSISAEWQPNLKTQRGERSIRTNCDYRMMECGHNTAIKHIYIETPGMSAGLRGGVIYARFAVQSQNRRSNNALVCDIAPGRATAISLSIRRALHYNPTMRKLILLTAAVLVSLEIARADESMEPPLRFTLTVNGQTATAGEGKPVQLKGAFNDPTITVNVDPYRAFSAQGVAFEYPRGFSFEADLSDQNAKIWTLAGNDLKIMLFVIAAKTDERAMADGMAAQFGRENVKESAIELTLGSRKISGVRQLISLIGHKLTNDVFVLSTAVDRTVVLVLQDNPQPSGDRSTEGQAGVARLSETYRVTE